MYTIRICLNCCLAIATLITIGCSGETQVGSKGSITGNGIPSHWDQISFSVSTIGDRQSFQLVGKNQSLEAAVDQIAERLEKPIIYGDQVDPSKKLAEFRIEIQNGTWTELLNRLAESFGYQMKETDEGFEFVNGTGK